MQAPSLCRLLQKVFSFPLFFRFFAGAQKSIATASALNCSHSALAGWTRPLHQMAVFMNSILYTGINNTFCDILIFGSTKLLTLKAFKRSGSRLNPSFSSLASSSSSSSSSSLLPVEDASSAIKESSREWSDLPVGLCKGDHLDRESHTNIIFTTFYIYIYCLNFLDGAKDYSNI